MASAADVPGKFDVIINGEGYRLLDSMQASLSFRTHHAIYGYSPTFVERSNVQGDYGDNQQDFWLTVSERDWTLGEQQRYYRNDAVASRRYFRGTNVDVTVPGQVRINDKTASISSFGADPPHGACAFAAGTQIGVAVACTTNLFEVTGAGVTNRGAHGLGVAPQPAAIAFDGQKVYISSPLAGTVGVRAQTSGTGTFATFSASGVNALAFHNNTLYGSNQNIGVGRTTFGRYDTAGAATTLYTWNTADATGSANKLCRRMLSYGGRLLILMTGPVAGTNSTELYQYDGVGVSKVTDFPGDFSAWDMAAYGDVVFIMGLRLKNSADPDKAFGRPAIYAYVSGSLSLLWQAEDYLDSKFTLQSAGVANNGGGIATFRNGCIFHDLYSGNLMYYDTTVGGTSSVATGLAESSLVTSGGPIVLNTPIASTNAAIRWPETAKADTATITTSLFDFDSSLPKYVKAVQIDADIPAGASIQISYFVDKIPYTTTTSIGSASSGIEVPINTVCRSIGFVVTLVQGVSGTGPTLKKLYVRAAPMQQTFRNAEYYLDLTGRDGLQMLKLRNNATHTKDGLEMATDLFNAANAEAPFTITDRFGTFTGIIEPDKMELRELRPEEFAAHVVVRET